MQSFLCLPHEKAVRERHHCHIQRHIYRAPIRGATGQARGMTDFCIYIFISLENYLYIFFIFFFYFVDRLC